MADLERRAVAFLDILGFRELVTRIDKDADLFKRLRNTLKVTYSEKRRWAKRRESAANNADPAVMFIPARDVQFTAFSDCIVSSTPRKHALALALVTQDLASRLLAQGFLTRGAIVEGRAYHDGQILIGPAIVEAYELESNVAKYARIILTDTLGDRIRRDHWKYYGYVVSLDPSDGCNFIDVFARWACRF